jgi:hypothetical protein
MAVSSSCKLTAIPPKVGDVLSIASQRRQGKSNGTHQAERPRTVRASILPTNLATVLRDVEAMAKSLQLRGVK